MPGVKETKTIRAFKELHARKQSNAIELLNGIAKKGEDAQTRNVLTNALNEFCQRVQAGYEPHRARYNELRKLLPQLVDVKAATFKGILSRQNRSSPAFDLSSISIFLHHSLESHPALTGELLKELHPYHRYLIDWSRQVLEGGEKSQPLNADDWSRKSTGNGSTSYLSMFSELLKSRNSTVDYWEDLYRGQTDAGFVLFRHGLNESSRIVQTYLSISSNSEDSLGVHTFAHVYRMRRSRKLRLMRGFAVPTQSTLYLIGFTGASVNSDILGEVVSLRQPMEILAIPMQSCSSDVPRFPGLTLTNNESGDLLISRIVLRRTPLPNHNNAKIGVYDEKKLKDRLSLLHGAETLSKDNTVRNLRDLELEVEDILLGINNLRIMRIADLQNSEVTLPGGDSIQKILRFFTDHRELADDENREFNRALHWRLGGIGRSDPSWS